MSFLNSVSSDNLDNKISEFGKRHQEYVKELSFIERAFPEAANELPGRIKTYVDYTNSSLPGITIKCERYDQGSFKIELLNRSVHVTPSNGCLLLGVFDSKGSEQKEVITARENKATGQIKWQSVDETDYSTEKLCYALIGILLDQELQINGQRI